MATVSRLERRPNLGRLRRDLNPPDIRSLVLPRYYRYLLFYRYGDDMVEVFRIKHGLMDLPRLFGENKPSE